MSLSKESVCVCGGGGMGLVVSGGFVEAWGVSPVHMKV